jgi:hypothetical protein
VALTDEQQIAEALRQHGLTLVKTSTGYAVLKLGQIDAHGITKGQPLIDLRQDAWSKINSPEQVAALDKTIVDFASGTKGQP